MDWSFLYDGLRGPLEVVLIAVLAYAALVAFLRVSGKRTLSDMNAFDFVVTVALGSTLATTILSPSVPLVNGLAALLALIALQAVIAYAAARSDGFRRVVKSEPRLLVHKGQFLTEAVRKERLSPAEVEAAMRAHGVSDVREVYAVVLETNGEFSVVPNSSSGRDADLMGLAPDKARSV